jgi:hypothetical protein
MAIVGPGIPGRHNGPANLIVAAAQSFCVLCAPRCRQRKSELDVEVEVARPTRFELVTSAFGGQRCLFFLCLPEITAIDFVPIKIG